MNALALLLRALRFVVIPCPVRALVPAPTAAGSRRRPVVSLAACGVVSAVLVPFVPAGAEVVEYGYTGVVTSTQLAGSGFLPADVKTGAKISGIIKFEDSMSPTGDYGTSKAYGGPLDYTVNFDTTSYTKASVSGKYLSSSSYIQLFNDHPSGTTLLDGFSLSLGSYDYSNNSNQRNSALQFVLQEYAAAPVALSSTALSGIELDVAKFSSRQITYWDMSFNNSGGLNYQSTFGATIQTLVRHLNVGNISSGSVTAGSGEAVVAGTATGGTIDASAGSATISNLAGASLTTGASGATVTTLSSGNITANGGTITTSGGSFTGSIAGTGSLEKTGAGTLTLSSANTYSGGTTVTAGTVEITRGDAIGSAPVVILNNGRFRAVQGVDLNNPVVSQSPTAVYEHSFTTGEDLSHYGTFTDGFTSATLVAGDLGASSTVSSSFQGKSGLSLSGLDQTRFLMVLQAGGAIPVGASPSEYYLGWNDPGDGLWKLATLGNHGTDGEWAGAYTLSYQSFLDSHGGWNGAKMLGAYGVDSVNGQVWAVIDHNSNFGVTNLGTLVTAAVPEIGTAGLGSVVALVTGSLGLAERRRRQGV